MKHGSNMNGHQLIYDLLTTGSQGKKKKTITTATTTQPQQQQKKKKKITFLRLHDVHSCKSAYKMTKFI